MIRPVVLIESPFSGRGLEAIRYLACCLLDSVLRGEAPIASHAILPLCLPENVESYGGKTGRDIGLECRGAMSRLFEPADLKSGGSSLGIDIIAYTDLGVTSGMNNAPGRQIQFYRILQGEALRIWNAGEWPSKTRWSSTNE